MNIPLRQYLDLLSSYLKPQGRRVAVLAVIVLINVGLQVANPQVIRLFIDDALAGEAQGRLLFLAGIFIGVALLTQLAAIAATFVSETVGWTATNALRSDLARHCLGLDMSFHKTKTPGEMIQRLDGDIDALSNFFSQFVLYLVANCLLLVSVLVLLFFEDWRIGLALSVFALGALAILVYLRSFAVSKWVALREETAQFYGFLGEQLRGTEDIRANGARPYARRRFYEHLRSWLPLSVDSGLAFAWMWMSSLALFTVGNAVALIVSYFLWDRGALTIGSVYLVFHYTELLRRPIDMIREQVQQLQSASASIVRVSELFQVSSALPDDGQQTLPAGPLSLEFKDVSFGYEADEPVLKEVSLRLEPGQVLGLLGRTGSGKTTMGRLLVRLYDRDEGEIELNGVPIRALPLAELRDRVKVVTQDVQLMEGTVRDNLTFFDPSVPDQWLVDAIRGLGLAPWLASLSAGLDTEIDPRSLSAGEAQLLACTRAFLSDPGLVVLDEATSRLDPATQRLIDGAFGRLLTGRTAIIVAHRLATVDRADLIAVLEDGEIVELGEREALLADPQSRFHHLHSMDLEALLT
jgi:ATP-binding cassette subfamily B protein